MHRFFLCALTGVFCTLGAAQAAGQVTIFVDADATGVQDGTSWCTAYRSLSAGLTAAVAGDTVLVADGVYVPSTVGLIDPRDATFAVAPGVSVSGGFAGCGAVDPDEQDPLGHPTVLSGDLNGDDAGNFVNVQDNCWNVVRATGSVPPRQISLQFLTITGGNADGACCGGPAANGGGLYIAPTALLVDVPSVYVGGCTFRDNAANRGGAVASISSVVSIEDSVFEGNAASYNLGTGGAVFALTGTVELRNCFFVDNAADNFGGAIVNGSTMTVHSATMVSNVAGEDGGGVYNSNLLTITDSILWENIVVKGGSAGESAQVVNTTLPEALVVNYTCIQGLTGLLGGVGNIGDDPLFRPGPLDTYYLANGSSDPGAESPCVDAGSDSAVNLSLDHLTTSTDEAHDVGVVDMGYHRPISGLPAPTTGDGDSDGDVDLRDVAAMQSCYAGPDQPVGVLCRPYEYDGDGDIDELDYPPFSVDLTGP